MLFYHMLYYIIYHFSFILINISDDGWTEARGRPRHANNLILLQTDNLQNFLAYERAGENFEDANPSSGKFSENPFRVCRPEFFRGVL